MKLINLLKVVATAQTVRVLNHYETIYTGELGEWDDAENFKDWEIIRVYVGVFGTLTIKIERGIK